MLWRALSDNYAATKKTVSSHTNPSKLEEMKKLR